MKRDLVFVVRTAGGSARREPADHHRQTARHQKAKSSDSIGKAFWSMYLIRLHLYYRADPWAGPDVIFVPADFACQGPAGTSLRK